MKHEAEAERIRFKTELLVVRHHLDWAGLAAEETFADFGCASGEVLREAARIAAPADVVGLDSDPGMIAFARAESDRLELSNVRYVEARIVGVGSTPLPSESFDHAWARFFLEYARDPLGVVLEMRRVVRPGGRVTLIDLDGNCVWHYPVPSEMRRKMDVILADLASTGFDPHVGRTLADLARRAGLQGVRESIEPYHRIVGRPDDATAEAWKRKLSGIAHSYRTVLFPDKANLASFFDELLAFIMREDTMTWSNAHLVQGTRPP